MIKDQTVGSYLDALASRSATPGGGAAAALTVAQAAALVTMVCNFTLGRERFAAQGPEVERLKLESEGVRSLAIAAVQDDVAAYEGVRAAYGLQTNDPSRQTKVQQALKTAALVPAQLFELMERLAQSANKLRPLSNPDLTSDIDVALSLLMGAAKGLSVMAKVNLNLVQDTEFRSIIESMVQKANRNIQDASESVLQP